MLRLILHLAGYQTVVVVAGCSLCLNFVVQANEFRGGGDAANDVLLFKVATSAATAQPAAASAAAADGAAGAAGPAGGPGGGKMPLALPSGTALGAHRRRRQPLPGVRVNHHFDWESAVGLHEVELWMGNGQIMRPVRHLCDLHI